ncbi:hypothetical protein DFH05DRAFT_902447 [Lentinula detonsa]|uniref:RBR-type E3 ubiquitin transferase n=1 Tax=Lentinula detonsa TaxID=2804962 RepID=A0A9W8P3A4_9AGAR|nr:hypothetical protein DFH05DRAFT_902447 [Lentinula detonsa]
MATIPPPLGNIDRESALLIAQLALGDIDDLRGGTAIPDQQYALELMAQDFAQVLSYLNNIEVDNQHIDHRSHSPDNDSDAGSSSSLSPSDAPQIDDVSYLIEFNNEPAASSSGLLMSGISQTDDGNVELPPIRHTPSSEFDLEYPPQASSSSTGYPLVEPVPTCVICMESYDDDSVYRVQTCEHYYCASCLAHYVETCINDESLFPPKCCGRTLNFTVENESGSSPVEDLVGFLEVSEIDGDLSARLRAKASELKVSLEDRVYCPYPRCSKFLGSWASLKSIYGVPETSFPFRDSSHLVPPRILCTSCLEYLCVLCKGPAHVHLTCPVIDEQLADDKLRNLAREKKWQTCPKCKAIIELTQGCNHIVCRCGSEFCYTCGSVWTSVCVCRQ